jgi:hypothetical protein
MVKQIFLKVVFPNLALAVLYTGGVQAQSPMPGVEGYNVEWVYRVRYGFIDEW